MDLDVNGDHLHEDVDEALVKQELQKLGQEEFAILIRKEDHYIQTLRHPEGGMILEYQEGSLDEHFEAEPPPEEIDDVIEIFLSYLKEDDRWRTLASWQEMEMMATGYVIFLLADSIDSLDDPFETEERVELPGVSLPELANLYGLIVGLSGDDVLEEFVVEREIEVSATGTAGLVKTPARFRESLKGLNAGGLHQLAGLWIDSDGFPDEDYELDGVEQLLGDLSRLAADEKHELLICDYQ